MYLKLPLLPLRYRDLARVAKEFTEIDIQDAIIPTFNHISSSFVVVSKKEQKGETYQTKNGSMSGNHQPVS